jgi:hypothetical protein
MKTKRGWIAAALLGIVCIFAFNRRPEAAAQPGSPQTGTYQIATFPGRAPQFGNEVQGAAGCYLVNTATGELWTLSMDGQQKRAWKKIADAIR